jgi:hypothetical protein
LTGRGARVWGKVTKVVDKVKDALENVKDEVSAGIHRGTAEVEQQKRKVAGDEMTTGEKASSMIEQQKQTARPGQRWPVSRLPLSILCVGRGARNAAYAGIEELRRCSDRRLPALSYCIGFTRISLCFSPARSW